jgi:DNA-binding SARP family transcriptional activator
MGASMGEDVETTRESHTPAGLQIQLIGQLTIRRDGIEQVLPASRKVRALFAYLALSPSDVGRSELCELLWDVPNDPRGELRWCLSKIRALMGAPGNKRVRTRRDAVGFDLSGCFVDALEIVRATERNIEACSLDELRKLAGLFGGEFLDGLELDRSPAFNTWLTAQRRRYRSCQAAILERLARGVPDEEALTYLDKLVRVAPFDLQVHAMLLSALARRGRLREGEEHLAATAKLFEAEDLDAAPLREAWRLAKAGTEAPRKAAALAVSTSQEAANQPTTARQARRASIAVMPFLDRSIVKGAHGGAADALAHDVITRLAKLRSLFVIAQGTVFALRERGIGPEESGRVLGVDYVVAGSLERRGQRMTAQVELMESRTARIIWAETYEPKLKDTLGVLDEIGNRIVSSVVAEIETLERNRAVLKPPSSLDAWEAYHRGLWHMYRFTKTDNDQARHFFEMAARLDPTFSRAFAGLSFTYWQNAFQGWTSERQKELDGAYGMASQSLLADDRDPAAHWVMGRALWLRGRHDQAVAEFEQSVDLSPNFALAHYNLAFVHSTAGDAAAAISFSDHSRELSPFDPMLFGMLGARAMALVRLDRLDEAADWGVKAAARPNSFPHIRGIAAFSLALAGRLEEARAQLQAIHEAVPGYNFADFQCAFRFDATGAQLFRKGAKLIGVK